MKSGEKGPPNLVDLAGGVQAFINFQSLWGNMLFIIKSQ